MAINKITSIYNFLRNIDDIMIINIYDINEINDYNFILNEFSKNYNFFFNILYENKINIFCEYDNLKIILNYLVASSKEFIIYIKLLNDFNTIEYKSNLDLYINEDLYKMIKIDIYFESINKIINNISDILIKQLPKFVILYLNKIKIDIISSNNLSGKNIYLQILNDMINKLEIDIKFKFNNLIFEKFIIYGSYYIILYQDLNIYKPTFNWASFNFNIMILNIIKSINNININIFENYYNNPEINIFYKQVINYSYLNIPFNYINLENTNINN